MRSLIISALLLGAFVIPGPAAADEVADRSNAIALCRTEITAQTGLDVESVRFDSVRMRLRVVRVDFDVWRDGLLTNVRCEVAREAGALSIASITPALTTASALAR